MDQSKYFDSFRHLRYSIFCVYASLFSTVKNNMGDDIFKGDHNEDVQQHKSFLLIHKIFNQGEPIWNLISFPSF